MKNQKGITLVALVVTIVVLLILAGVTIVLVMQGDSIFGKAQTAKTETNEDNIRSIISLALLELQTTYYDPDTTADVDENTEATAAFLKNMKGEVTFTATDIFTKLEKNDTANPKVPGGSFEFGTSSAPIEMTVVKSQEKYDVYYEPATSIGLSITKK